MSCLTVEELRALVVEAQFFKCDYTKVGCSGRYTRYVFSDGSALRSPCPNHEISPTNEWWGHSYGVVMDEILLAVSVELNRQKVTRL